MGIDWSSTTYAPDASRAWYVYLNIGTVVVGVKTFEVYVWPVRGGK